MFAALRHRLLNASIRDKLLFSFSIFLLITVLLMAAVLWLEARKDYVLSISERLNTLKIKTQEIDKLEYGFFADETINPAFYQTGASPYLDRHRLLTQEVQDLLIQVSRTPELQEGTLPQDVDSTRHAYNHYEQIFDQLVSLTKQRGFKDFGTEGEMRRAIHELENSPYPFDKGLLLTLRRHEKDFILRKDLQYPKKLAQTLEDLKTQITSIGLEAADKRYAYKLLAIYQEKFTNLVRLEEQIGFSSQSGLRGELAQEAAKIDTLVKRLYGEVAQQTQVLRRRQQITLWGVMVFSMLLIVFFAIYITRLISNPIQRLSSSIRVVVQSKFAEGVDFHHVYSQDEIGRLSKDFNKMLRTVRETLQELEKKSQRLERKQEQTMAGLRYAQRMQQAILPERRELQAYFQEVMLIYEPQDVVSGDFYWFKRHNHKSFIAAVDCTGHGVPGAFMSIIGTVLFNQLLSENPLDDPALMLEAMHIEVMAELNQDKYKNNDAMEVCLCMIEELDQTRRQVTFCGAKRPLLVITQNGDMHYLKGVKRAVGGGHIQNERQIYKPYENQTLVLEAGDILYLFSDGILDQPGGQYRQKFGLKRLKQFALDHYTLPLPEQEAKLRACLNEFMGEHAQRDDATIVGIRLR
jgi:serine phosphatase RsbU (regulator of sigma subunit)